MQREGQCPSFNLEAGGLCHTLRYRFLSDIRAAARICMIRMR